jgi:hypothetical protein
MENQQTPHRNILQIIFLSAHEPRLRAGWRLLIQTLTMVLVAIGLSIALAPLTLSISGMAALFLSQIAELIAFVSSIFLARRFLDKRTITSLGLRFDRLVWQDLTAGIGITFVLMGLIFAVMAGVGWLTFQGFAWEFDPASIVITNTLIFFVVFIFVGWNEELLSRGYHLQTLASGTNLTWGVLISASIFGLLHFGNPGATWVSTIGIVFAGFFLALGYLRTGRLWLSIGLHIGWNFFEGVVFGFPVSGLDTYPLIRIQVHGPELWTGGVFGPEAGLIVLPALLIGAGLIYLYTRSRTEKPDVS